MHIIIRGSSEDQLKFIFKCFGYTLIRQNRAMYDILMGATVIAYVVKSHTGFCVHIQKPFFMEHRKKLMELGELCNVCYASELEILIYE